MKLDMVILDSTVFGCLPNRLHARFLWGKVSLAPDALVNGLAATFGCPLILHAEPGVKLTVRDA